MYSQAHREHTPVLDLEHLSALWSQVFRSKEMAFRNEKMPFRNEKMGCTCWWLFQLHPSSICCSGKRPNSLLTDDWFKQFTEAREMYGDKMRLLRLYSSLLIAEQTMRGEISSIFILSCEQLVTKVTHLICWGKGEVVKGEDPALRKHWGRLLFWSVLVNAESLALKLTSKPELVLDRAHQVSIRALKRLPGEK